MNQQTTLFYRLTLANYLALVALFAIWAVFFENPDVSLWIPLLVRSLPILIFLPGLLSKNVRSFAWLCFVAMLYICYGVFKAVEYPNVDGVMGILTTLFALDIIVFALLFIRSGSPDKADAH
ncbi:MAG TPA: DUF2069 domain-containing protein [Pseudomonadales bacterium]|nr:DUF2069 domain-containing protein [Pseudomonadales bacterium]